MLRYMHNVILPRSSSQLERWPGEAGAGIILEHRMAGWGLVRAGRGVDALGRCFGGVCLVVVLGTRVDEFDGAVTVGRSWILGTLYA